MNVVSLRLPTVGKPYQARGFPTEGYRAYAEKAPPGEHRLNASGFASRIIKASEGIFENSQGCRVDEASGEIDDSTMRLTVTTVDDTIYNVEIDDQDPVGNLKAILEAESSLPMAQQTLLHDGRELKDDQAAMGSCGLKDGDVVMMMNRRVLAPAAEGSASAADAMATARDGTFLDPEAALQQLRGDARSLAHLSETLPDVAEAVRANDAEAMQAAIRRRAAAVMEEKRKEAAMISALEADPFNPENQAKIQELIQKKNVQENYLQAYDHTPELLIPVHMLYVVMEINRVQVKAFIDSGAQMTIMTEQFAEKCSLTHLIDTRFQGMAVGVGSSKILGRIHAATVKVGDQIIQTTITVLEQKSGPQFIFGLDNLKRHSCCIDLKQGQLRIGSCDVDLPFLPEHETPPEFQRQASGVLTPSASNQVGGTSSEAPGGPGSAAPPQPQPAPKPALAAPAPAPAPGHAPDESKVNQLVALSGRSREECVRVLQLCNGDVDAAASMLLGF